MKQGRHATCLVLDMMQDSIKQDPGNKTPWQTTTRRVSGAIPATRPTPVPPEPSPRPDEPLTPDSPLEPTLPSYEDQPPVNPVDAVR